MTKKFYSTLFLVAVVTTNVIPSNAQASLIQETVSTVLQHKSIDKICNTVFWVGALSAIAYIATQGIKTVQTL